MPSDLGPIASKPPVRVVQSNAPAPRPQSQGTRIASDRLHADPDLELYETTQMNNMRLIATPTGKDTPSITSPLENSLTPKYRKNSEPEVISLPPGTRLEIEQQYDN